MVSSCMCWNFLTIEDSVSNSMEMKASRGLTPGASPAKRKNQTVEKNTLTWPEKYRPKIPNEIVGNQSLVFVSVSIFLPLHLELNLLHVSNFWPE